MEDKSLANILEHYPVHGFSQTLIWEAVVQVTPRQDLGQGPLGQRFIVPITGGHFKGGPDQPEFYGEVVAGGADRQLLRPDGIKELSALYEMRVHDGTVIGIDNQVIVDAGASPMRYAMSRISVTAPEGPWSWLNRKFFLGSLHSSQPNPGFVVIRGWQVDPT